MMANPAILKNHSFTWSPDYDGGGRCFGVTGWGTHSYDQVNRALGTDATGPVEVLLEEPVADRTHLFGRYQPWHNFRVFRCLSPKGSN